MRLARGIRAIAISPTPIDREEMRMQARGMRQPMIRERIAAPKKTPKVVIEAAGPRCWRRIPSARELAELQRPERRLRRVWCCLAFV